MLFVIRRSCLTRSSWWAQLIQLCSLGVTLIAASLTQASELQVSDSKALDFYQQVLNAPPFMPANLSPQNIGEDLPERAMSAQAYLSAEEVDYSQPYWEQRIAHNWHFFTAPDTLGKILLIDFKQLSHAQQISLVFRYLANADSQDSLYEPWSSSKIFAFTAAIARVRQDYQLGADSLAGDVPLSDLITSIHSYMPTGKADGNSNAIATYFANVAGRDRLTALFHDQWLLLSNPAVRFRGAYDTLVFAPSDGQWHSQGRAVAVSAFAQSSEDPGYQAYRCEQCGLTGNNPMTTLAQAEWLKRLATHRREPLTRMPILQPSDLATLFWGQSSTTPQTAVGGMMQGISLTLHYALAAAINDSQSDIMAARSQGEALFTDPAVAKQLLDQATQGQWRIWQKIGWGDSETRSSGETVVLAHVSLPYFQGGKEFTIAAQTSQSVNAEAVIRDEDIGRAGIKMQHLLYQSLVELFASTLTQQTEK